MKKTLVPQPRASNEQLSHLRQLNNRGQLSLFVGAGISQGCGLPSWDDLVSMLLDAARKRKWGRISEEAAVGLDNPTKARLARSILGGSFNDRVADALYSKTYSLSSTLREIAKLGISRICTFNIDDLLEEAIAEENVAFHSVSPLDSINNNFPGITIYHVHGFLTSTMKKEARERAKIILSERDYNDLYSAPYSWPNVIQLSLLASSSCLFVGCSLKDPNVRRLLDIHSRLGFTHRHFAILQSPMSHKEKFGLRVAKEIKMAMTVDLTSLSVEPIWIGRYEEIPKLFRSIRCRKSFNKFKSIDYGII